MKHYTALFLGGVEKAGEAGAAVGLVDVGDVEAVLGLARQLHAVQDPLVLPPRPRALDTEAISFIRNRLALQRRLFQSNNDNNNEMIIAN